MTESRGQKLIRIPEKDHYYYDEKSLIIYYLKKNLNKIEKVSSEIKYDGKSSLIKASRIIPIKLKEKYDLTKKKTNKLNKLLGDFLDDMIDRGSHFHMSKKTPVSSKR